MSNLIVIRLVPQHPVDAATFATYLAALGDLQITAYDLSFDSPGVGQIIGTAVYKPPASGPQPTSPVINPPAGFTLVEATYAPGTGIVQQIDLQPAGSLGPLPESQYFTFESVATAVITVTSVTTTFENLRLVAQWGSGASAPQVPIAFDFYNIATSPGPAPADLNNWSTLAPSLYISLPKPPSGANPLSLDLSNGGAPPAFDALLAAVKQVLADDPGPAVAATTSAAAAAGDLILKLPTTAIVAGMSATGAGIPAGTLVASVDAGGASLTLSQQLSTGVGAGATIKFAANIGALSVDQCRNIAYEIVWSQQPSLPLPPNNDPVENLYTNPPNDGVLIGSGNTPNSNETDRQQFEGQLKAYYSSANAVADQLTNSIYTLSCAYACELQSLAATQALLSFLVNPAGADFKSAEIILTGVNGVAPTGFGVPAGYFYALAISMPTSVSTEQRYALATGDQLAHVLSLLNAAVAAQTILNSEAFASSTVSPPPTITAAQAARQIQALGVPLGSGTPLGPLGALSLPLSAAQKSGSTLTFASTSGVTQGMAVSGAVIAAGTSMTSPPPTPPNTLALSQPIVNAGPVGAAIVFTPAYSAALTGLVQAWLTFPTTLPGAYQAGVDDTAFWPSVAATSPNAQAFLELALVVATQGYIIPAPFNVALGEKILAWLPSTTTPPSSPPTVATLAQVMATQWTAFFKPNPTWLPPTAGGSSARLAAFIQGVRTLFATNAGGPVSAIDLATSADTPSGSTLPFASTTGVVDGMSASSALVNASNQPIIPVGAVVKNGGVTATSVTLSAPILGDVPFGTNILFTPNLQAAATGGLPRLPVASSDWLQTCVTTFGSSFVFGTGKLDANALKSEAANLFASDPAAQAWLIEAVTVIDALCAVASAAGFAVPLPAGSQSSATIGFSLIEALYAAGFRSAADIVALTAADFQQALLGTVAHDSAAALYNAASGLAKVTAPGPGSGGGFKPVNDGSLVNCIPPLSQSPLGPVAYLNEMLRVSEASTCEQPIVPQAVATLGAAIATRRGPLGDLLATDANLETPLPLIDIVNENLEYAAATGASHGVVYDTSADSLAGFPLRRKQPCPPEPRGDKRFDPPALFGALPEYSTPAMPVAANAAISPAVYDKLKSAFSSCRLPYSQALDVNRSYMRYFNSCRFEEMRSFRRCITEFVLQPVDEPALFQDHLWRYPVRIDIAIEYLGITPEEHRIIFQGTPVRRCGEKDDGIDQPVAGQPRSEQPGPDANANSTSLLTNLRGIQTDQASPPASTQSILELPEFLRLNCLSYCEFIELWQCGFVAFGNALDEREGAFPVCEPCCLDKLRIGFGRDGEGEQGLLKLAVFIRLWRKLREPCCQGYSFAQLRDICDVLSLYQSGQINHEFIRQLAAFQMLRDDFRLELADPRATIPATAVDADRTHLLALWAHPTAAKWGWAVRQLIDKIEHFALRRHKCERRPREFKDFLAVSLDAISHIVGFDPASPKYTWHALPTHTLRFAEILAKLYASPFSVRDITYLFTAKTSGHGDWPFPMQDADEALAFPLDLPHDRHEHSLVALRHQLLDLHIEDAEPEAHEWRRIASELRTVFGFADADILSLGEHFFPRILHRAGVQVDPLKTHFVTSLLLADTNPQTWNTPPDSPFGYDTGAQTLWCTLPLSDEAVLSKLERAPVLQPAEQAAVQELYFQPRVLLAKFALLFADFHSAQIHLIEGHSEEERWHYLRRAFALTRRRRRIIAEHLARHAATACGATHDDDAVVAAELVLSSLFADENALAPGASPPPSWENDNGEHPPVTWTPPPNGGALAALLALAGTGLVGEYSVAGGGVVWREPGGALTGFGREKDGRNCPVPSVLPALNATIDPSQAPFVVARNGLLQKDMSNLWVGGAQGFTVVWSGALLVDREGPYEFWGGAPTPGDERPDFDAAANRNWLVTLKRGSRVWTLLSHNWPSQEDRRFASVHLRHGAYEISVSLTQPTPGFSSAAQVVPGHTGLQVKYAGPDSHDAVTAIPHHRLFPMSKDKPLGDGVVVQSAAATAFLAQLYVGSLRDIRRTYQRAFKALMFVRRFGLSAGEHFARPSELGYMLAHPAEFAGYAFYLSGGLFKAHLAQFDFNYLPITDEFLPPVQDQRTNPSAQRTQAMFDWWERIFDYTAMRSDLHHRGGGHLWRLFEEAADKQPADPGYLLRQIGAEPAHWQLDLRYYQAPNVKVYDVNSTDLMDERWVVRAWRADRWLSAMQRHFAATAVETARPDLWASDDPSVLVSGETATGNANLLGFAWTSALENGEPRRIEDIRRLNDGLRLRGRDALLAYLCSGPHVTLPWAPAGHAIAPIEISAVLLLDVEAGLPEQASRIEEAISAVQTFIRRARLGLESKWTISPAFAQLWDREFCSYEVWRACRQRHLYKENWLEWSVLRKARDVEAFQFLEDKLRSATLTTPVPGGLEWWPQAPLPGAHGLETLQQREPSEIRLLPQPVEGLNLMGTPERAARPSWLAAVTPPPTSTGANPQPAFVPSTPSNPAPLPLWMQAAIRMGKRFYRIAAAGAPPAGARFVAHGEHHKGCVSCCDACGCEHEPKIDEYFFWLIDGTYYDSPTIPGNLTPSETDDGYEFGFQDDFYDAGQQQSAYWQDPTQLPQLLDWEGLPMVRLAWCRVHNGVFQQPRRSHFGVAIAPGNSGDLSFEGRTADSLFFSVSNAQAPVGYAQTPPAGFRYDMAPDRAVTLPEVTQPPAAPTLFGGLPAYPYFVFVPPGQPAFPLSPFAPAIAVARWLRAHCRYEPALRWYRLSFDVLDGDNTWIDCHPAAPTPPPPPPGTVDAGTVSIPQPQAIAKPLPVSLNPQSACCDATDVDCAQAERRAIMLNYVEALSEWAHAKMRRRHAPEAFQQARTILDAARMILGPTPISVQLMEPPVAAKVSAFKSEFPPLNPRLLDIYGVVDDRLALIRHSIDAYRFRNGRPGRDMAYFGDSPLREGWRSNAEPCLDDGDWCCPPSPYRFTFLIQKATEYAGKVQELGGALLSALEKGDAEYLAALRSEHERELLSIGMAAKQDQWRDADWQVESLQKTKAVSQANLVYYNGLIHGGPDGLINGEIQYENEMNSSISLHGAANIVEAIGEGLTLIPDFVVGAAGFGGSPVAISWLPLGTKLGGLFVAAARIINNSAAIAGENASLDVTEAGWTRRLVDWNHQTQILAIEIQQVERQILGAQRRRDQMLREVNSHNRQMEQAKELQNFLRDKFTSHELYLFLQREAAALHYQTYDLALHAARQAERAFNLERGHLTRRFLPADAWNNLHEGLMAGERLSTALRHMEKSYFDENLRECELTKHVSLRLNFPLEYLRLRDTGCCEIEIPEWMFDQDFSGHYMRRIRNVTLTIPCVAGPYTGVHCRLTLLSSVTRIDPRLIAPPHQCCCPPTERCCCSCDGDAEPSGYELCPDDPRMVKIYGAREALATSSGQNDSGLFELSFSDPRYLPFEFMGAVSRWRIELPPDNNYFDPETLTDTVLHINYTAREGGERLRQAASEAARRKLPGDGWAFFDIRHDFPDAWELFRRTRSGEEHHHEALIHLRRKFFPYLPRDPDIRIVRLALLFETEEMAALECPEFEGCPCPESRPQASHRATLVARPARREHERKHERERKHEYERKYEREHEHERREHHFRCFATAEWPRLYSGIVDVDVPMRRRDADGCELSFTFHAPCGEIRRAFLMCEYEVIDPCCGSAKDDDAYERSGKGERGLALEAARA
jgi:hypothetical protein